MWVISNLVTIPGNRPLTIITGFGTQPISQCGGLHTTTPLLIGTVTTTK